MRKSALCPDKPAHLWLRLSTMGAIPAVWSSHKHRATAPMKYFRLCPDKPAHLWLRPSTMGVRRSASSGATTAAHRRAVTTSALLRLLLQGRKSPIYK